MISPRRRMVQYNPCPAEYISYPDEKYRGCHSERVISLMSEKVQIQWFAEPEDHDYPAALSYLSLVFEEKAASAYVEKLNHAGTSTFKAKDIFRASGLSLIGVSNSHVEKDRKKIHCGQKM